MADYTSVYLLLLVSTVLILSFGYYAFNVSKAKDPELSFYEWFNGSNMNMKSIMVGMVSGIVFGFIDNAGLFAGMDALEGVFKYLPGGKNANVVAGYGNTFSDMLGAFLGTFVGRIITDKTGVSETPIWSDAVGIVIGCLMGVAIPYQVKKLVT